MKLDPTTRTVLAEALIEALGEEVECLNDRLSETDRARRPRSARGAYERVRRIGGVLELIDWGSASDVRIDLDVELPVALSAVRRELSNARASARDSREHGSAEEIAHARARVENRRRTLLALESLAGSRAR